jgi:hypothetical protein
VPTLFPVGPAGRGSERRDRLRIEKISEPRTPATVGLSPASRMLTRASDSRVGRLSTTNRCPGRGATTKQGKPGWVQEAEPADNPIGQH